MQVRFVEVTDVRLQDFVVGQNIGERSFSAHSQQEEKSSQVSCMAVSK